jgi:DNA helicase-2/ATP-dependent DNA helicase PcrA
LEIDNVNNLELLNILNAKQQEAVTSPTICTIVLAGPGSGKTRTLTYRIAYLIEEMSVNPQKILAVTFTNKAAREMQERLEGLLGASQAKKVNARTFHSWGARMLRYEMQHLVPILKEKFFSTNDKKVLAIPLPEDGLANDFTIYDTTEQALLMKEVLNQLNFERDPKAVLEIISGWKNKNVRPDSEELVKEAEKNILRQMYRNCYVLYQAALFRYNACDFDDLILLPLLLFERQSERLQAYQEMTSHFLIDEFQDTNEVQYQLSLLLAQQGHIFVVGDEDQAIYGFRHADFKNVERLRDAYADHNLILLEQNYRSNQAIVKAATSLIVHNSERVNKKLWTKNEGTAKIEKFVEADEADEAIMAATIIQLLHKDGHAYKEMAILYRVNAQSREIESALVKEGIPYRLMQGTAFFDRREIRDVLAYLKFIRNGDLYAFRRLVYTRSGLGKKTEQAILAAPQEQELLSWLEMRFAEQQSRQNEEEAPSGKSVLSWLENYYQQGYPLEKGEASPSQWSKLAKKENLQVRGGTIARNVWILAQQIIELKQKVPDRPTMELIQQVIELLTPYISKLKNSIERLENAYELLTIAKRLEGHGEEGLVSFLDESAMSTDMEPAQEESQDKVTLSTMHRSKGLEWDNVLITGVEYNLSPYYKSIDQDGNPDEEERRLFYVGFTRARKNVYLLRTIERTLYGTTRNNPASPYLHELGI